jgi:hypothetical protein
MLNSFTFRQTTDPFKLSNDTFVVVLVSTLWELENDADVTDSILSS